MANTYTLIASNTLTTSAASVTFSAIPNTYTDLVLRWSSRSTSASSEMYVHFNSTTQFTYSNTRLRGTGSTAVSERTTSDAYVKIETAGTVLSTYTASTFSNGEIYIPNYTSTSSKQISGYSVIENNATASAIETVATLYTSANAITSVTFTNPLASGSSFFLYGIKNS